MALGPSLPYSSPADCHLNSLPAKLHSNSSGKLSLIKRVKPQGWGLAGSRLQQAEGLEGDAPCCPCSDGDAYVRGTHWKCHMWTGQSRGWDTSLLRSNKVTKLQFSARPAHDPSRATGRSSPGWAVCSEPGCAVPQFPRSKAGSVPPPKGLGPGGGIRSAGQSGCPPGCTFGLNPGVPLRADTSKNNRPERGANHRLFIARHP